MDPIVLSFLDPFKSEETHSSEHRDNIQVYNTTIRQDMSMIWNNWKQSPNMVFANSASPTSMLVMRNIVFRTPDPHRVSNPRAPPKK